MENYYLFLDDMRNPKDVTWVTIPQKTWIVARTYKEFVDSIKEKDYVPSFVSYDHDLSDYKYVSIPRIDQFGILQTDQHKIGEKTGYDCAKWLVDYCSSLKIKHPPYIVHSLDSVSAGNIYEYVDNYNFRQFSNCNCNPNCGCES